MTFLFKGRLVENIGAFGISKSGSNVGDRVVAFRCESAEKVYALIASFFKANPSYLHSNLQQEEASWAMYVIPNPGYQLNVALNAGSLLEALPFTSGRDFMTYNF